LSRPELQHLREQSFSFQSKLSCAMPKVRGRDAELMRDGKCAPIIRIFGKITVSAASADKRPIVRLLDQKQLHPSRRIDHSRHEPQGASG
jgi:hypothetical protein